VIRKTVFIISNNIVIFCFAVMKFGLSDRKFCLTTSVVYYTEEKEIEKKTVYIFAKSAQNLATRPSQKFCAAIMVLKIFQNLRRQITESYSIFGYVTSQNIDKYKER
jgi:hypothetical protein